MKCTVTNIKSLLVDSAKEWSEDKASRLGAALAYYTIFSIAPLLLITIAIAGFVLGEDAARGTVSGQISSLVGPNAAEAIETMIANAGKEKGTGIFATIVSAVLLLFGASGVFVQLKDALNTVWDVPEPEIPGGIWGFIRARFLSFGFVLGAGFLLLTSLIISTVLSGLGKYMGTMVPMAWLMQTANILISFGVITVLFAMIFKFLPDIKLPWKDVWYGAIITTVLFTLGKWGLGQYLGRSSMASSYGAAGSLVVLLVWIYYSAQIAFFGAEVTQIYSRQYGAWRGRDKRTSKQKEVGVAPRTDAPDNHACAVTSSNSAIDSNATVEETSTESSNISAKEPIEHTSDEDIAKNSPEKPNPVGEAIGKVAGLIIAGKAGIDAVRDKKK